MKNMANKYIYFLFIVVSYSKPIKAYFLNDDLGTNLPDRFGDAINDNWQDKRLDSSDYSSFSKEFENFPSIDGSDYDYKNGNADTQDEVEKQEKLEKRESGMKKNFDKVYSIHISKKTNKITE